MAARSGGKACFEKIIAETLWVKNVVEIANCSISLRFQDKNIFVFNAEIQDGPPKWWGNDV